MKASCLASLIVTALALAAIVPQIDAAPAAGTTQLPPIDLSPGFDVPSAGSFVLNRSTHKLYVSGHRFFMLGVKVIDTRTNVATGGLSFGTSAGGQPFRGYAMAVDESPGPDGNKLYVVGSAQGYVLRVVDGQTDTNLTGAGTDIILPLSPTGNYFFFQVAVNPTTHKVYVSPGDGQVIIIDGPTRQVLKTVNPNAGSFLAVDPVANKIFVLGANGGAIIDGVTDNVSAPPQPLNFVPSAAAFNEADKRLYLAASNNASSGLYIIDGQSGSLIASRTDFAPDFVTGIALVPNENTVYLGAGGSSGKIFVLDTVDLARRDTFLQPDTASHAMHWSGQLACDPAGSKSLFTVYRRTGPAETANGIHVVNRADGKLSHITTAYVPHKIAINARTNRIYVLDSQMPELVVVDGHQRSVLARVRLASAGGEIVVSERLNRVYHTGGGFVDGATNQAHAGPPLPFGTRFLAVDDTRRRLYASRAVSGGFGVAQFSDWHLDSYDAESGALVGSLYLGRAGMGGGHVAANPVTGRVYVSTSANHWTNSNAFFVVDGATSQVLTSTSEIAGAEGGIGINRSAEDIYLPQANGNIVVFDGRTNQVEASFPAGGAGPDTRFTGIAIDEEADTLSVTELTSTWQSNSGRMMSHDANNNHAPLGEMELGNPGAGLAFNPVTRQFLAPNLNDGTVTVIQASGTAPRNQVGNLSTRLQVGGSDNVMISGVIVNAPAGATKKVIVRAVGPSLGPLGVAGALADTTLELHTAAGQVITNDNWKIDDATQASQQAAIEATGLAPGDDREAAIIAELPDGAHTAVIRGKNGTTGVGLAEVFIVSDDSPAQLANIATRGRVGTGEDVMIAGVILKGTAASRVLVRAVGPSLQGQLAGALHDPMLELRDINGGLIAINDDWKSDHESEIAATTIPPTHDKESAILADLFPGNYTAIVWGASDTTGVAVVEAYNVN